MYFLGLDTNVSSAKENRLLTNELLKDPSLVSFMTHRAMATMPRVICGQDPETNDTLSSNTCTTPTTTIGKKIQKEKKNSFTNFENFIFSNFNFTLCSRIEFCNCIAFNIYIFLLLQDDFFFSCSYFNFVVSSFVVTYICN